MSLDTSTLYLVATMVAAMLGAMLLFFGRRENIPALKWWGIAYLLGAASVALWTLAADSLGAMLSLALSAVGLVACGMVWNASRVFHGRKPNLPGLVLGAIAWIAAVMMLEPEATAMRMTIGAGIIAVYMVLTAAECGRAAQDAAKALAGDRGAGAARFRADAADSAGRPAAPA